MCYEITEDWSVIPDSSPRITRNCPKCKGKSNYINTGNFRVNANGNCIDVWLIYQCIKCKSTYNLTLYERVKPSKIDRKEYQKYLSNNKELAMLCGFDKSLMNKNNVVTDLSDVEYQIIRSGNNLDLSKRKKIKFHCSAGIKVRLDKILADQFEISKSKVKIFIEQGLIYSEQRTDLQKILVTDGMEIYVQLKDGLL